MLTGTLPTKTSRKPLRPIEEGIELVGAGERGTRLCPDELIDAISNEIHEGEVDLVEAATFFTSLWVRGPSTAEMRCFESLFNCAKIPTPSAFYDKFAGVESSAAAPLVLKLLERESLTSTEAFHLGEYLFKTGTSDGLRAVVATVLRMRNATLDEYEGLLRALNQLKPFQKEEALVESFPKRPLVQLAPPTDGVKESYLLEPLLSHHLIQRGYSTVSLVSRSPGPKFGINLHMLAQELHAPFLASTGRESKTDEGFPQATYLDLKDYHPSLEEWVELRRKMKKRPFLATLEKFLNPLGAEILITSAFHLPFLKRGLEIARLSGFKVVIILFRTLESSLGLATNRRCQAVAAVDVNGQWIEKSFTFVLETTHKEGVGKDPASPFTDDTSTWLSKNATLIQRWIKDGHSGEEEFDQRVSSTLRAYDEIFQFVESLLRSGTSVLM